jgi:succinate-semialdehyde dehydrogenase/glutarate-semialdehyde dehydrogenase
MSASTSPISMPLSLKEPRLLRQAMLVDGHWIQADSGETLEIRNPSSGQLVARVPNGSATETRRSIQAAERAMPAWKSATAKERSVVLRRLYELMLTHIDDLARIMTAEQGKPLAEARGGRRSSRSVTAWSRVSFRGR